jgi:SAM-dependent methyltransferase
MSNLRYGLLMTAVEQIVLGRDATAQRLLAGLLDDLEAKPGDGDDLQAYLFASALAKRLAWEREAEINLYLRRYERSQISLFNLLADHLPTVGLASRVANEILAREIDGEDRVTLLDLGIGTGRQEAALLRLLAERRMLPRQLHVVAVEPEAGSLRLAVETIEAAAREVGAPMVRVHPVQAEVEELSAADWAGFRVHGGPLLVNAAFALHHVLDHAGGEPVRDAVFARLRAVGARTVVLCEPNSDHRTNSLRSRFDNAWAHFGQTFRLIDSLGLAADDAGALKLFFAREIEDILARAEANRYERHEPVDAWVRRLAEAGFVAAPGLNRVTVEPVGGVHAVAHDGFVGLDHRDQTLVAIVAATAPAGVPVPRVIARAAAVA